MECKVKIPVKELEGKLSLLGCRLIDRVVISLASRGRNCSVSQIIGAYMMF